MKKFAELTVGEAADQGLILPLTPDRDAMNVAIAFFSGHVDLTPSGKSALKDAKKAATIEWGRVS